VRAEVTVPVIRLIFWGLFVVGAVVGTAMVTGGMWEDLAELARDTPKRPKRR